MTFFPKRADKMLHFTAAQLQQVMYVYNTMDGGSGKESNKIHAGAKNKISGKCLHLIILIPPFMHQKKTLFQPSLTVAV
jgi:hypothetical protein